MMGIILAAAETPFSWDGLAAWGPALPMFVVMCWFGDRLFKRFVEKGFRDVHDLLSESNRRADERHKESMLRLERIEQVLKSGEPNGRHRR